MLTVLHVLRSFDCWFSLLQLSNIYVEPIQQFLQIRPQAFDLVKGMEYVNLRIWLNLPESKSGDALTISNIHLRIFGNAFFPILVSSTPLSLRNGGNQVRSATASVELFTKRTSPIVLILPR